MSERHDPVALSWNEGDRTVTWTFQEAVISKALPEPPQSVLVVLDPPSVIVVEAMDGNGQRLNNAVIYEPDGRERVRLVPPDVGGEPRWRYGFYTVHAEPQGLVAVFATAVGDFWGRPDLETGELSNVSQWR